jgi:two-component system, OmpR family, response regulator RegX3
VPRVLLIEDELGFGEALEYQLGREGYDVDRTTDGIAGLERWRTSGADLVLLDLMLPGMPGEDICKEIRRSSNVPIIMLTARDAEIDKVVGLELGADDYVTKPFSMRELVSRVRAHLRRAVMSPPGSSAELTGGPLVLDPDGHEVFVGGRRVDLPPKEFDLLELLLERKGRLLTRDFLISQVWGHDYVGDTKTLDVHVKRLRQKIEEDPHRPRYLLTVRGLGYKFVD